MSGLAAKNPVRVDVLNDGKRSKKSVETELNKARNMMTVSRIKTPSQNYDEKCNANYDEAVVISSDEEIDESSVVDLCQEDEMEDEEINKSAKDSNVVDLIQEDEMEDEETEEESSDEDTFELID